MSRVYTVEDIHKLSMFEIAEMMRGRDDLMSMCIANRIEQIYLEAIIGRDKLLNRIETLEMDIEELRAWRD